MIVNEKIRRPDITNRRACLGVFFSTCLRAVPAFFLLRTKKDGGGVGFLASSKSRRESTARGGSGEFRRWRDESKTDVTRIERGEREESEASDDESSFSARLLGGGTASTAGVHRGERGRPATLVKRPPAPFSRRLVASGVENTGAVPAK